MTRCQLYDDGETSTTFESPSQDITFDFKRGGMVGACLGYPFTMAELKELERQAIIYKYMMASIPVPSHLLLPINTRNYPSTGQALGAEPGRCKRTDGKKWWCPRDIAPNQKYYVRHMNGGWTRSRKSVEVDSDGNGGGGENQQVHLLDCPSQPPLPATQLIGSDSTLQDLDTCSVFS